VIKDKDRQIEGYKATVTLLNRQIRELERKFDDLIGTPELKSKMYAEVIDDLLGKLASSRKTTERLEHEVYVANERTTNW
jgi:hypothetical protein